MDYTEIIDKEAERYRLLKEEDFNNMHSSFMEQGFIDGLNSALAKQITEIEKLEFAIKVLSEHTAASHYITSDITELETLRDKLINELKLK